MNKILVALDGSPRSVGVLDHAVSHARLADAKVVLFRSYSIPPEMALAWPASDDILEQTLRSRVQAYLDDQAKRVPKELFGGTRIASGSPWQAVCAAARKENVDLVVIGSHGYSGIDLFIGTNAAKIVNHADRPVLVVRTVPPAE